MFDYTNRMIYLLCPMELHPKRSGRRIDEFEAASNSISNSVADTDSIDAESGFEDQEVPVGGQNLLKHSRNEKKINFFNIFFRSRRH